MAKMEGKAIPQRKKMAMGKMNAKNPPKAAKAPMPFKKGGLAKKGKC